MKAFLRVTTNLPAADEDGGSPNETGSVGSVSVLAAPGDPSDFHPRTDDMRCHSMR